jgi:hypothetical protein
MAYIGINLIVSEICLNVSIVVARACFRNRINFGCLGLCSCSCVIGGFPSLRVVLSILLRAEPETPAASRSRVAGARLGWFGTTLCRWLSTRG